MPRDAVTSESCNWASCVVSVVPRYAFSSVRVAYVGGAGLAASTDDGGVVSMTAPLAVQYQNHTPAVLAVNDESYTPVEVCVTDGLLGVPAGSVTVRTTVASVSTPAASDRY